MSLIHPKGTRLATSTSSARVVSGKTMALRPTTASLSMGRVVSGKTKALRPQFGLLGTPAQSTHTVGGVTTGVSGKTLAARALAAATGSSTGKSGKTIANRPVVSTSPPVVTSDGSLASTGDSVISDPAPTGAKSGATMFQRNLTNLEVKIIETVIIAGLLIGGIYLTRKYRLLQGGR